LSPHVVMVGPGTARAAEELRSRAIDRITVVVDDPEGASSDCAAEVARSCGFSAVLDQPGADLGALNARLDHIKHCLSSGHWSLDDPALPVRDAIADSDAVVIAGAGFGPYDPGRLYEAAALAAIASHLGRPLVLATHFGPRVSRWERLAEIVDAATVVVASDPGSYGLIGGAHRSAGSRRAVPRVLLGVDMALGGADEAPMGLPAQLKPGSYVALTLPERWGLTDPTTFASDVVVLVSDLRVGTGLPVVVVPRTGSLDPLARSVANGLVVPPIATAEQAASIVRHAALVVAYDRYGAVLGHSAAIPTLAVAIDADAQRELGVIQRRAGLGAWCVSALGEGQVAAAAAEAWERRAEITALLNGLVPQWVFTVSNAWDIVAATAKGKRPPKWIRPTEPDQLSPTRPWTERNADLVRVVLAAGDRLGAVEGELGMARRAVTGLTADLARLDQERAAALDRIAALEAAVTLEQAAAAEARELAALRTGPLSGSSGQVMRTQTQLSTPAIADPPSKPSVLRRGEARVARAVRHALGNRGQ